LNKKKIAFIHSSAGPNDLHKKYALSVGATLIPEDSPVRLYQQPVSKFKLITGWLTNALGYFKLRKYDVIICDSFRVSVTLANVFGILKRKQKIILFFGSEQLIKLKKSDYSQSLSYLYNLSLRNADGFINLGTVNQQLTSEYDPDVPSLLTFNGIAGKKILSLLKVKPAIDKNVFFVMANVSSVERIKIKGVDIALAAFKAFKKKYATNAELFMAGEISNEAKQYLTEMFDREFMESITFIGKVDDLPKFFTQCTFGLNLSRYDSWSLLVNESLLAGIPCLVSKNTGSLEMVKKVNKKWVVSEDIDEIVMSMYGLCNLNIIERKKLSDKGRLVSKSFTEEKAIFSFQQALNYLIDK